MRRYLLLALLLFSLSFASVNVVVEKNVFVAEEGKGIRVEVLITNTGDERGTFKLVGEGMLPWLFIYPSVFTLYPGENATAEISFSPSAPPATYLYALKVIDEKTKKTEWEGNLVFIITETRRVSEEGKWLRVSAPAKVKPGEIMFITLEAGEETPPATVDILILKDDAVISTFSKEITKTVEKIPIQISETDAPGIYTVRCVLKGVGILNQTQFEIEEMKKVSVETNVERKFMGKVVKIYVKNSGNVKVKDYLEVRIPFYERVVAEIEPPADVRREGNAYILKWAYSLRPGEKELVGSYSVDYTPYFLIAVLLGLGILIVLQTSKPVDVRKTFRIEEGEGRTTVKVTLHIANNSDKEIENVKVVDKVPKICHITKFRILKPEVKEEKEAYTLEWDLGTLKPGEERVLAYELSLGFGIVGQLSLPEPLVILTEK